MSRDDEPFRPARSRARHTKLYWGKGHDRESLQDLLRRAYEANVPVTAYFSYGDGRAVVTDVPKPNASGGKGWSALERIQTLTSAGGEPAACLQEVTVWLPKEKKLPEATFEWGDDGVPVLNVTLNGHTTFRLGRFFPPNVNVTEVITFSQDS